MCVFVCISHTCRNLNFAKNVTTLLHWADDMKCLINSVKNSSSKKKKKKIPTDLPYFCSARYANITIFFFWPNLFTHSNYLHYCLSCALNWTVKDVMWIWDVFFKNKTTFEFEVNVYISKFWLTKHNGLPFLLNLRESGKLHLIVSPTPLRAWYPLISPCWKDAFINLWKHLLKTSAWDRTCLNQKGQR